MNLVEKHIVRRSDPRYKDLMELCHLSKNLYNVVLYTIRQHWFKTEKDDTVSKKFLNYYDVWKLLKNDKDYKAVGGHSAQHVIRQVETAFSSFFSLLNLKSKGKYSKRVRLPKYLPKDGYNMICFDQFKKKELEDGFITLPKSKTLRFRIKNRNIHFISVVPKNDYVQVNFIYKKQEPELKPNNGRYMGIDLGVGNLATCASNVARSIIIDGKPVKHINRFFNKKISEVRSEIAKKNGKKHSRRTSQITLKRNCKIDDYFHKASRKIINYATSNDIRTIIVGHNVDWKKGIDHGKENNQNFVCMPHDRLIHMLKYKGKLEGITVIEVEEGYTSKCSFLDDETIESHAKYSGKRSRRGLFRSKSGKLINADVNGAFNIMRKGLKCNRDAIRPADVGFVYNPVKTRV